MHPIATFASMLQVSALYIYPIKSLGGIAVNKALVTDRGFQYDRRWMLVDGAGNFLSQRKLPQMALLQVGLDAAGLLVHNKKTGAALSIPFLPQTSNNIKVTVWDSRSTGIQVSEAADAWFTEQLHFRCQLVFMSEEAPITVDPEYAHNGEVTSFSDGYPFLLIGQSSLDDLNSRLSEPLSMNRFRPNIVVSGATPFAEDNWAHFHIEGVQFFGVKLCARCVVTTINQDEGIAGKEPLKTLATYRQRNNKIYFGQNLLHQGTGLIQVNDPVHLLKIGA